MLLEQCELAHTPSYQTHGDTDRLAARRVMRGAKVCREPIDVLCKRAVTVWPVHTRFFPQRAVHTAWQMGVQPVAIMAIEPGIDPLIDSPEVAR